MGLYWRVLELLFPGKCILCGALLHKDETDLCRACRVSAPVFSGKRDHVPFVTDCIAVWYYEDKVRESILRYKFGNRQSYGSAYARLLAMKIRQSGVPFDLMTWVPISRRRRFKRGYDQVELLARGMERELEVPAVRAIDKVRHNAPQSTMQTPEQRKANVLGAYRARKNVDMQGKRILLLDDVITTGATLSECAKTLRMAGAREVFGASVAVVRNRSKCR